MEVGVVPLAVVTVGSHNRVTTIKDGSMDD